MLLNFKVSGYAVFGDAVEFNLTPEAKNNKFLDENIHNIITKSGNRKAAKSAVIFGGNNNGKSSLLKALREMKAIYERGDIKGFNFELRRNFCYKSDGYIRFELTFLSDHNQYIYGLEFKNDSAIGEYLYLEDLLLFSRDDKSELEGSLFKDKEFEIRIKNLPLNKLIVSYVNEYTKDNVNEHFVAVENLFNSFSFVDNDSINIPVTFMLDFGKDPMKMDVLNKLISTSNLYVLGRKIITEQEVFDDPITKSILSEPENNNEVSDKRIRFISNMLRITSMYQDCEGNQVRRPSCVFDSIGTNKFVILAMRIIDAMANNKILFIDEIDSSLHYKLTRGLVIFMNSEANKKAQFIITTHDVKLLSPMLFRKDQIDFIDRNDSGVEIIRLDEFKANSDQDIRSNSNFEKMYIEEKIVSLPETDISSVIEEFQKYDQADINKNK